MVGRLDRIVRHRPLAGRHPDRQGQVRHPGKDLSKHAEALGWTWRPMMGIEPPKRPAGRGARPDNGAIDIDGEAWELQMANGRRGYVVVEPQEWDQCPLRELLKPFDQGAGR